MTREVSNPFVTTLLGLLGLVLGFASITGYVAAIYVVCKAVWKYVVGL